MSAIEILNNECFEHIFKFFGPKDWVDFSKVCKRWSIVTDLLWREKFEIRFCPEICPTEQFISLSEMLEVLTLSCSHLKNVTLQVHETSSEKYLCTFGKHQYKLTDDIKLKKILQVLSDEAPNIDALKILNFKANGETLWKKLVTNSANLTSFKMHFADGFLNYNDFIKDILMSLPEKLEKLRLSFTENIMYIYIYDQVLDKFTSLKQLHISSSFFQNKIITTLLKHVGSLKKLCLHSTYNYDKNSTSLDDNETLSHQKLLEISNLVNLEKIHLAGSLPVTDETISKIIENCSNITEFKLGRFFLSEEVLALMTSLPKLEKLNLIIMNNLTQFTPSVEMKKLKELKVEFINSQTYDFAIFFKALGKMPVLSSLTISEYLHEFCRNPIFAVIEKIVCPIRCVKIKPLGSVVNCVKEIEIYDINDENKNKKSKKFFELSVRADCLDYFSEVYRSNENLLPNCEVFIQYNENFEEESFEDLSDDFLYDGDVVVGINPFNDDLYMNNEYYEDPDYDNFDDGFEIDDYF